MFLVPAQLDKHTHTHTLGSTVLTSDQLVADTATYTTYNKLKRPISVHPEEFEPAILDI